jgi:hypothetical protein
MESFKIDKKIVSVKLGDSSEKEDYEGVIVTDVKLPTDTKARLKTLKAEGKKWYLTVAYHPDSDLPFAMFCHTNNKEKSAQTSDAVTRLITLARSSGILEEHVKGLEDKIDQDSNVSKLTRVISLLLRHRVKIAAIVKELDKMEDIYVGSFLFQVKKFLSQYIKDGEKVEGATCSNCGSSNLIYSEGCMQCADCGNSKCS